MDVSIHASRTGRDARACPRPRARMPVSIHASRTGRDLSLPDRPACTDSFNPRVPYGTRPTWFPLNRSLTSFNPRVPYGTRHADNFVGDDLCAVSIHASRTGRDQLRVWVDRHNRRVSIHASRTGRDPMRAVEIPSSRAFQSTRPVRDATVQI